MKKLVTASSLLLAILALSSLLSISAVYGNAKVETETLTELTLQEWFDQNGYAINATADETGIEAFKCGYYRMSILAEIADYAPMNNLSWYPVCDGEPQYIIYGDNSTGTTVYFMADQTFGLCLGSPDGYFYTEASRNIDEKDHALVYVNPNAAGYLIAWEDLLNLGDADYQDLVLAALSPIDVSVHYCPRTLNLKSNGRWITALIRLPDEYKASEVVASSILLNGTIHASVKRGKGIRCGHAQWLVVKFSRAEVIELVRDAIAGKCCRRLRVSLTVTGSFSDGTPFQGTNKITVIHCCCLGARALHPHDMAM